MTYINLSTIETKIDIVNTDLSNATDGLGALKTDIENFVGGNVLTPWSYSGSIAANAGFIPASDKIGATMNIDVADALRIYHSSVFCQKILQAGKYGLIGLLNFDGSVVKLQNANDGNNTLSITGYTMS